MLIAIGSGRARWGCRTFPLVVITPLPRILKLEQKLNNPIPNHRRRLPSFVSPPYFPSFLYFHPSLRLQLAYLGSACEAPKLSRRFRAEPSRQTKVGAFLAEKMLPMVHDHEIISIIALLHTYTLNLTHCSLLIYLRTLEYAYKIQGKSKDKKSSRTARQ